MNGDTVVLSFPSGIEIRLPVKELFVEDTPVAIKKASLDALAQVFALPEDGERVIKASGTVSFAIKLNRSRFPKHPGTPSTVFDKEFIFTFDAEGASMEIVSE